VGSDQRHRRRRPFSQSAALRWSVLPRIGLSLTTQIPHEPTRRRMTMKALHDTDAAFNRGVIDTAFIALAANRCPKP
jgi:hypothetical protein